MTQSKTKILKQNVISLFHTHYEHVYSLSDKMLKSRKKSDFPLIPKEKKGTINTMENFSLLWFLVFKKRSKNL